MKPIKEISGNTTPIYAWQSCSTAATIFLSGPEYLGGNGDLAKKLEAITAVDEQERFDEAQKVTMTFFSALLASHLSVASV